MYEACFCHKIFLFYFLYLYFYDPLKGHLDPESFQFKGESLGVVPNEKKTNQNLPYEKQSGVIHKIPYRDRIGQIGVPHGFMLSLIQHPLVL
jgi:hypothetical protein